jgi:hypothetical protein
MNVINLNPRNDPAQTDTLTVLTCRRGIATKTFRADKVVGFTLGKYFDGVEWPISGPVDLFRALTKLSKAPKSFVIRGAPIDKRMSNIVRRSIGPTATFAERPTGRRWACFDFDSSPGTVSPGESPAGSISEALADTPLRDVTFVWQASSQWGIKPGIRAHVWVWLEAPRTDAQVLEWVAGVQLPVDRSLFNPVQPHYTAAPVFKGCTDPLAGYDRVGIRIAADAELYIPMGDVDGERSYWVSRIEELTDGDPRHPLVNRAAYSLGGWVGAGIADRESIVGSLLTACERSGAFSSDRLSAVHDEIDRAVRDGARKPRVVSGWKTGLRLSEDGSIKAIPSNLLRIFSEHPDLKGRIAFDVRKHTPICLKPPPWAREDEDTGYPRELKDSDDISASAWLNSIGMLSGATPRVREALNAVAERTPIDRVVEWLDSLPSWDGIERLSWWVPMVLGVTDSHYHREVGRKFVLSMIARAFEPGCKADYMIVLTGPQGIRKSMLLEALSSGPGPWAYCETLGDIRNPQHYIPSISGPWLVEEGELATFSRRQVEAVKHFLTVKVDRARPAYGRRAIDFPRRCVFAGTSNPRDFLTDPSGNRRFWPIDVTSIDIEYLLLIRDQLFAEAVAVYRTGEAWYLGERARKEAEEVQADHLIIDPWTDLVQEWLDGPAPADMDFDLTTEAGARTRVTTNDVLSGCLEMPSHRIGVGDQRRVSAILKRLGWERIRNPRNDGGQTWAFQRPRNG